MPTYDYRCARCGDFQALRSIALRDEALSCPGCAGTAPRVLSAAPHVGGVRRAVALAAGGDGGYARLRHPASCRCCSAP